MWKQNWTMFLLNWDRTRRNPIQSIVHKSCPDEDERCKCTRSHTFEKSVLWSILLSQDICRAFSSVWLVGWLVGWWAGSGCSYLSPMSSTLLYLSSHTLSAFLDLQILLCSELTCMTWQHYRLSIHWCFGWVSQILRWILQPPYGKPPNFIFGFCPNRLDPFDGSTLTTWDGKWQFCLCLCLLKAEFTILAMKGAQMWPKRSE